MHSHIYTHTAYHIPQIQTSKKYNWALDEYIEETVNEMRDIY